MMEEAVPLLLLRVNYNTAILIIVQSSLNTAQSTLSATKVHRDPIQTNQCCRGLSTFRAIKKAF